MGEKWLANASMKPDAILPSVMIEISVSVIPILFLLTEEIRCLPGPKKNIKIRHRFCYQCTKLRCLYSNIKASFYMKRKIKILNVSV